MKTTVSWFGAGHQNVIGGSEVIWSKFKKLGFEHVDYDRAKSSLSMNFPYNNLGFPEVDGAFIIEEYLKQAEKLKPFDLIIKNSMQLPLFKPKCRTICYVQDLHKYAAEQLYKIGAYDMYSYNRIAKTVDLFQRLSMENADEIIYVSEFAKHVMGKEGRVIPHGVDLELFKPMDKLEAKKSLGLPTDKPVALWIGRFHPQKGWHIITELIKKFPQIHWAIMFMDNTSQRASPSVDNVTFLKPHEYSQMPRIYNAADFFILPSLCESFGLSSLEACACGVPIIHTRTGWLWDKKTFNGGFIIDKWDTDKFSEAIDIMLDVYDKGILEPRKEAEAYPLSKWEEAINGL
jgi:glycosyltransferase involved in cell wall biosynthesis